MPPYNNHLKRITGHKGENYQKMNHWMNDHPQVKAGRNILDKLPENINFIRSLSGNEGIMEDFQDIVEDVAIADIETLKKVGSPDEAVTHSVEVARKALEISYRVKIPVNRKLIIRGGIYHDLGKAKTYGIKHGEIGARMAKELNLGENIIRIILKHIRGGMTESEALELGLPVRDYTLYTPEEKIVIYSDRLVDIYTDGIVPGTNEQDAETRFVEILNRYEKYGKNPLTLKRYIGIHQQIQGWML